MSFFELPIELIPLSMGLDGVSSFLLLRFDVPEGLSWKPVESTENKIIILARLTFVFS